MAQAPAQSRPRRRLELAAAAVVLAAGLIWLFWEVFRLGYVQVPADILFLDPVLREAAPPGFVRPQNDLLSDHVVHFYVMHSLAAHSMQQQGRIPLWDPYILAGTPLVANAQSALFYPPNLLLFWLTPATVATLRALFNIFIAGIFTYLFCRALTISFAGAVLSAVAFAFSGAILVGPGHPYANSLVWLPLCFWATENLVSGSRVYFWGLLASAGIGLSVVGGHPETTIHLLMVVGLYAGARLIWSNRSFTAKVRLGAIFLLAVLVGALLGAVQWLPLMDFLSKSGIVSRSRSSFVGSYFFTPEWLPNLSTLVTLLYPNFFGNPENLTYFWPFSNFQNYLEQAMYFGLIPLALAVGALNTERRKRATVLILTVLALLSLAIALRLPGFEAFNYLPILDRINNTRLKWIFSFLGAVLAGFGLDGLGAYILSRKKEQRLFVWASALPVLAALLIFLTTVLVRIAVALKWIPASDSVQKFLATIFSFDQTKTMVSVAAAMVAVGCFAVLRRRPQWLRAGEGIAIIMTLVELIVVARGYNTTMPAELIAPPVRLTQELRKDPGLYRILAVPPTFWPNYPAVYGISSVGGLDLPVFKWSMDVHAAQGGQGYRQVWSPEWPLVDWMNIKYVISASQQNLPKLSLVFSGDGYYVYRNEAVLPRAYLVYQAAVMEDRSAELQTLVSGTFDFKNRVLLEKSLPPDQSALLAQTPGSTPSQQVNVVAYENDRVTMDVSTSAAGLLVMSDVYDSGWQVRVDGELSPLYRANYAYRAVFVPVGSHLVQFDYRPSSFAWGGRLTILGLALLLVGLPVSLIWGSRSPAPRHA